MKFENEIIKTFLPKIYNHRHDFFVIDNIIEHVDSDIVTILYRDPFTNKITISKSDYNARVIGMKRKSILNEILS